MFTLSKPYFFPGEDLGSLATMLSGPSYDCLVGGTASTEVWLGFSWAPPLVLWLLTMTVVVAWAIWREGTALEVANLKKASLKVSIVVTNCFLPDMVAGLIRFFPCIHFQYGDRTTRYLQYNVTKECASASGIRIGALLSAFALGSLLGPVYWVAVVRNSAEWKDRKATLGFLISGYNPDVPWCIVLLWSWLGYVYVDLPFVL